MIRMRFHDWQYPEIPEGTPTKYHWLVAHRENLRLGYGTDIGAFTYINALHGVTIEDFVQIGSHCSLYSHSSIDNRSGPIHLERNCRVGTHSVVMPSVSVGRNSVIGAFSLVNANIPGGVVAYGIPARVMRMLSDKELAEMEKDLE
jgi:acetyltransferase-like isoleucine patch superfamily enzyme